MTTQPCPSCGVVITETGCRDLTPGARPRPQPHPGDVAICPACGAAAIVAPDGRMVRLSPAEVHQLRPHIRAAVQQVQRHVRSQAN